MSDTGRPRPDGEANTGRPRPDGEANTGRPRPDGEVRRVLAEMVANVWKVTAAPGDSIEEGGTICILESMKMEIPVEAPIAGTLTEVRVAEGGVVQEGDVIAVIEPS